MLPSWHEDRGEKGVVLRTGKRPAMGLLGHPSAITATFSPVTQSNKESKCRTRGHPVPT